MSSDQNQPTERDAGGRARPAVARHRARGRVAFGLGLAAYSVFLAVRGLLLVAPENSVTLWELHDPNRLLAWLAGFALGGFFQFALFIPLGFLAAMSILRRPVGLGLLILTGAGGTAIAAAVAGRWWGPGAAAGLVLAWLGCLFGVWAGSTWRRGPRARLWLLPKVALLAGLAAAGTGVLLWLSVETEPLPFEPATVTSARKRELVRLVRSKNPRSLGPGQTHTLRLTEDDVNVLLAWGLPIAAADSKARVTFEASAASMVASVPVTPAGRRYYLNLQWAGAVAVEQGDLRLRVDRLRLGRLEIPSWLVNLGCGPVASLLRADYRAEPFFDAIVTAGIGPGSIEATYTKIDLPPEFREDLFGPTGAGEEVLTATRAQIEHLLAVATESYESEPVTFERCFEIVFTLARERSVEGDPVVENRGAVFALGVLLGHRRLEEFLGPVLPDRPVGVWLMRQVRLRGRDDWTKHFCVSAAIALLSDTVVSDAAGLLKEELDASAGGSGFSFADLLADRAGTTFAVWATRDEVSARIMQERIARGFNVDDVFPEADGLPEGISDAEFQSRYGGVGGPEYQRLVDDIERRISGCAAYHWPR